MLFLRSLLFIIAFYIWSASFAIGLIPLMLLAPRRIVVRSLAIWGQVIIWLLAICCNIKVEVRGREHMPRGPALIAAKHQCMFDVFAQFAWLPYACFVMKKELVWIPVFGLWGIRAGSIIVDRDGHSGALRKMVRDAKDRFAEDRQVMIFPEGTRMPPGVPGQYKPGIAALYRELDIPVHPVATNSGVHWPAHGFLRHPGTIVFEYLEPIPAGLKRGEFMRVLEEKIETASGKLLTSNA